MTAWCSNVREEKLTLKEKMLCADITRMCNEQQMNTKGRVNGHRKQQQSYTENQQNCFFF